MAMQMINLGIPPKGETGDTQRTANEKINRNFRELEARVVNGGTVEGVITIEGAAVNGGFSDGLNIKNKGGGAGAATYFDMYLHNTCNASVHAVDTGDGGCELRLINTPPGSPARDRREDALRLDQHGNAWVRAYGWLHDHFMRRTGDEVRGNVRLLGTDWAEGTIQESRRISCSPDSGGRSWLFHRRNSGHYDEAVLRAEVSPENWKDFKFRSNGNAYAPGSWLNASDIRLKENITPLGGMRALLAQIQPIHYIMHGQDSIGYSAQELQHVLPDCVHVVGDTIDKDGNEIKDSLAVNYSALTAFNTQILKEQEHIICKLLERVRQLEIALGVHETA